MVDGRTHQYLQRQKQGRQQGNRSKKWTLIILHTYIAAPSIQSISHALYMLFLQQLCMADIIIISIFAGGKHLHIQAYFTLSSFALECFTKTSLCNYIPCLLFSVLALLLKVFWLRHTHQLILSWIQWVNRCHFCYHHLLGAILTFKKRLWFALRWNLLYDGGLEPNPPYYQSILYILNIYPTLTF